VEAYLDYREKNGYTVHSTTVYGYQENREIVLVKKATVYVGRSDNPAFVGPEDLDVLAARIHMSVGPSGKNKDYLYELDDAVRRLAPQSHDSHLTALVRRVKVLDSQNVPLS